MDNRGVFYIHIVAINNLSHCLQIIMPRFGWRWLIAVSCFPSLLVLLLSVLTPESPRYLCVKGKMEEAHKILEKVASMNRTKLPPGILMLDQTIKTDEEHSASVHTPLLSSEKQCSSDSYLSSFLALFSPKLWRITLLVWVLYFATTFSYYGIVFLSTELSNRQTERGSTTNLRNNDMDSSLYRGNFITALAGDSLNMLPLSIIHFLLSEFKQYCNSTKR